MTLMLSIETARALRAAGLVWEPAEFDTFIIPDRDLDERQFVINEMPAHVAQKVIDEHKKEEAAAGH